ncbi:hypothetical protein [Agromyces sp. NPDC060279]|uniref:DUF7824 domain-containing protein n=1 Tax=Agromyces sp. NPDC060279 TaxID=3347092 RepID=UPI00364BFFCC
MTDALARSLEVFRELGWDGAPLADAPTLPIGTEAQQRDARAGLRRGDWTEWAEHDGGFARVSLVGETDHGMLALFAIRTGVDARRAEDVLGGAGTVPDELAAEVLATRGPEFATAFIARACRSNRRAWEHSTSVHAGRAVRLVHHHDLPVPESVEYLKDWSVYAALALGEEAELFPQDRGAIDAELLRPRFAEHVRVGIAVGAPATGPFGRAVAAGVVAGWIARDEAVALVLLALDAAQRPGDRKAWAGTLVGALALSDTELVAHAGSLLGALSHAEAPVVVALAPALIEHGEEDDAAEAVSLALTTKPKAARRAVLDAAARRRRPLTGTAAETVRPALAAVADGRDAGLAKSAAALLARWGLTAEAPGAPPVDAPPVAWGATPPLWEVPRFTPAPATVEALSAAAERLASRPENAMDLEVDRFLELANAVARSDPDRARLALRGLKPGWRAGVGAVADWVAEAPIRSLDRLVGPGGEDWRRDVHYPPATAREAAVAQRLGEVPTLLSTPSWDDLRIDPEELLARLRAYRDADAAASEADLLLALLRVERSLVTPAQLDELATLEVPVLLQSGERMASDAGPAARAYLLDPLREPALVRDEDGDWSRAETALPASLSGFPPRLDPSRYGWGSPVELPGWGDGTHSGDWLEAASGYTWRQLARRARPFGPRQAAALIGGLRSPHEQAAGDMFEAVLEAWERGLLVPGVADLRLVDRGGPSGAAQLARVAGELAEAGLGSLVWPLLDSTVEASLAGVRLIPGTAELVEAIDALLPSAQAAVAAGVAEASVLELPGTRALAARSGSSRAVAAARAVVARLPEASEHAAPPATETEPAIDLDDVWPAGDGEGVAIDDGVEPGATVLTRGSKRFVPLEFALAEDPGVRYRALMPWAYALDREGQLDAETVDGDERRWIEWDEAAGRLSVSEFRDRSTGGTGPRSDGLEPPLTSLMVAVVLASLCSDVESRYSVDAMVAARKFSAASVRLAARRLLPLPELTPARMMGSIERELRALPVLWPLLTESVRFAAAQPKPPAWLNRVLDVALLRAPVLRAAASAGRIPADDAAWPGLAELAGRTGSSAALGKARTLLAELGLG